MEQTAPASNPPIPAPKHWWMRAYIWQSVAAVLFVIGGVLVLALLTKGGSKRDAIILGVCLLVSALILGTISISLWREDSRKRKRLAHVAECGVPIKAQILSVYQDYAGFTPRARARFGRLDCVYYPKAQEVAQTESGQSAIWLFTSERFLRPAHKFEGYVTVYVVPSAPDDYYVDLNSLEVTTVQDASDETPDASI